MTMFTLDLSGHDADKKAGINRYGGLFLSIDDAVSYGHAAAGNDRLHFRPEIIWVRDEEGEVVRRDVL